MTLLLCLEALSVGLILMFLGILHSMLLRLFPQWPQDMNNFFIFAFHLFIFGIIVHLLCEYTGINKWYCKNGVACR